MFLARLAAKVALNSVAVAVAARYISGFVLTPRDFGLAAFGVTALAQSVLVAGALLAALNLVVRPMLKMVSFPLIVLTFGLFLIVINIAILYIADLALDTLTITGLAALVLGSILIGIANSIA